MNLLTFFGAPALLLARTLSASVREGLSWRECLRQLNELGSRSMWLVMSGMVFWRAHRAVVMGARPSSSWTSCSLTTTLARWPA